MKEILALEESGNVWERSMEKANPVLGFKLRFICEDESQATHQVEVRSINFQDLMRHLQRGESILITPKLDEDFPTHMRRQVDRDKLYVNHF